jgi:hypothetical protein
VSTLVTPYNGHYITQSITHEAFLCSKSSGSCLNHITHERQHYP